MLVSKQFRGFSQEPQAEFDPDAISTEQTFLRYRLHITILLLNTKKFPSEIKTVRIFSLTLQLLI